MMYPEKTITLRDGRTCVLRVPCVGDAEVLIDYLRATAAETEFVLRTPNSEFPTVEQERTLLERWANDPNSLVLLAVVEGEHAGNCQIEFNRKWKIAHRASVAIALRQKFWGCGIGTALMQEVLSEAERRGIRQTELDVVAENSRARGLYEKMGFRAVATLPDAIRFSDGSLHDEIHMMRVNTK